MRRCLPVRFLALELSATNFSSFSSKTFFYCTTTEFFTCNERLLYFFCNKQKVLFYHAGIKSLKRLRVLYLGGNRLRSLPAQICQLHHLHALILCDNRLESLPECICCLSRLKCLQLHRNQLTTIPYGLVQLDSLSELSLRENPLVVRFVREMSFQPSSLLELAARVVTVSGLAVREGELPATVLDYLGSSRRCVNPSCKGVYFNTRVGMGMGW